MNNLNLEDLIDIEFLQELQDIFARTMNMASITCYGENLTTKPSNFTHFCTNYSRSTKEGFKRCLACDIEAGKLAAKKGSPIIYKCHAGLTDFAIPIIVEGQHLGSILGGQILTSPPDEEHFKKIACEIGVDEQDYIKASKKINIVSEEQVKTAANLLYKVANAISKIGHQNLKLLQKNNDEELCQNISEMIRFSVDFEQTKQKIVEIVGKALNADRCLILDYDKKSNRFGFIDNEYLSSSDILSLHGRDPNYSVPNFAKMLKEGVPLIINDRTIYKNEKAHYFDIETEIIKKYDIDSALIYPLYYFDDLLGAIAIHYVNKKRPVKDEEIKLLSVIANQIAIAIHQSKLYKELKKTTANQNAILNNIPFMAWLKDENSKLIAVNDIFSKTLGFSTEEVIGKNDFDLFSIEYAQGYVEKDKLTFSSQQTTITEEEIPSPNGTIYHETFKSPVFDEKGNVIGTAGLARDITERKAIEKELRDKNEQISNAIEREKLIREIITQISSSLDANKIRKTLVNKLGSTLNSDLSIIYIRDVNTGKFIPVDENSMHRSSEDIINPVGQNIIVDHGFESYINTSETIDIIYPDIEDLIKDYKLNGKAPAKFFETHKVKSMIGIPLIYAGKFLGLLIMNFIKKPWVYSEDDVNLVKIAASQASIALHQSILYSQVQEASKAKSEFIANMSHEIKTPLNVIIGFSDLLAQTEVNPEKQLKYLENINKSGKHLLHLTNDIINISKIESGTIDLKLEKVELKNLITDVIESLNLMAKSKNLTLSSSVKNINIFADKIMLTQILYNLLCNAIKFTPKDGKIEIYSKKQKKHIAIFVQDSGIGIPPEHLEMIFENFKQVDSSLQRQQQGAGLGLTITKKLINLHNGSIHVESKEGKGSKFWFTIPIN